MISIPKGFHAAILSTAGEEMIGGAVPNAFDGMAAFAAAVGSSGWSATTSCATRRMSAQRHSAADAYDEKGPGGNTTLEVRVFANGRASW